MGHLNDTGMILETERLIIEQFKPHHSGFILKLLNSPGWIRYIGDREVRTLEQAQAYIENGPATAFRQYGYGFSVMVMKENGELVGGCGLIRRQGLPLPDIGYALLPEYSGQGYAFEAAQATLDYAKEELGLSKILAICQPENERSVHLLKKLGFVFDKMIRLTGEDKDICLFEIELFSSQKQT